MPPSNSNTHSKYKTTRPPHALLHAGTKQALQKTINSAKPHSLNPSALPASVSFFPSRSTADGSGSQTRTASTARTQEVDIVGIVGQQFLDPGVWEGMKRVGEMRRRDKEGDGDGGEGGTEKGKGRILGRKEAEEEDRRRREREAEFGGMAVRGRIRGNV